MSTRETLALSVGFPKGETADGSTSLACAYLGRWNGSYFRQPDDARQLHSLGFACSVSIGSVSIAQAAAIFHHTEFLAISATVTGRFTGDRAWGARHSILDTFPFSLKRVLAVVFWIVPFWNE